MKPAIASLFALGTTFCLMGTKTRHEVPTFGTSDASSISVFNCDDADLNDFLVSDALTLQGENVAKTYLAISPTSGATLG